MTAQQSHESLPQQSAPALGMPVQNAEILEQLGRRYDAGFVTDIESETLPPGLDEDVVRFLSAKKNEPEWMTEWRLAAYRHWLTMTPPQWAKLDIAPIDFKSISYYSAPKAKYASSSARCRKPCTIIRTWSASTSAAWCRPATTISRR